MGQNIEDLLRAADTAGKLKQPAGLQKRLSIVAALLRDAPRTGGPRLLWRDEHEVAQARAIDCELLIGRESTCDIVLASPRVSRRHCRVWPESGHVWVEDLGSASGTIIAGHTVSRLVLCYGDVMDVGGVALAYDLGR